MNQTNKQEDMGTRQPLEEQKDSDLLIEDIWISPDLV
jgi:hypothetical protein